MQSLLAAMGAAMGICLKSYFDRNIITDHKMGKLIHQNTLL